jgi:hemerythrin-like metal-binding protein
MTDDKVRGDGGHDRDAMECDFFTGLPEVDRQHEALFALVNRLHDAKGHRAELLEQAFADLRDYVREHFATEERFMAESRTRCRPMSPAIAPPMRTS